MLSVLLLSVAFFIVMLSAIMLQFFVMFGVIMLNAAFFVILVGIMLSVAF